jgi:hypothetical protein
MLDVRASLIVEPFARAVLAKSDVSSYTKLEPMRDLTASDLGEIQ